MSTPKKTSPRPAYTKLANSGPEMAKALDAIAKLNANSPRPLTPRLDPPDPKAAQLVVPDAPTVEVPTGRTPAQPVALEQPKPTPIANLPIETKLAGVEAMMREMEKARPKVTQAYTAESQKWGHLVAPYMRGNGIELATGGAPIVPTSIQFELSPASYARYNSGQPLRGVVHWRSDTAIIHLPFRDSVLDYVASSHLLEDFEAGEQFNLLKEWVRVLKPGGKLVVCVPDKQRWAAALAKGQPPNCAHRHELKVGELSTYAPRLGLAVIMDKLTDIPPGDYNIAFVGQKV